MVQKYQNEIPPIFYYGISTKTSEKDLKIPNLQALTLGRIIKMTLYLSFVLYLFHKNILCVICVYDNISVCPEISGFPTTAICMIHMGSFQDSN